jgi:hypothetical protein
MLDLIQLGRLQLAGGQVLQRYEELTREADASAHGSPAQQAKAQFEKDWETDPAAVIAVEAERAAGAKGEQP